MTEENLFVDYVWIDLPKRTVSIQVSDGNIEKIRYKFDDEGANGFQESVNNIQQVIDDESICYVL
tara:strand:+ start:6472 stop:6666 length:195 start_codon:yes stop_codon:yes gene_type:complete